MLKFKSTGCHEHPADSELKHLKRRLPLPKTNSSTEEIQPIITQFICTSEPYCLCVGKLNEWDECCCTGNIKGFSRKLCENCGAVLIQIDWETGHTITPEPNEIIEIDIHTGGPIKGTA
jgi:hypothetical protein